MTTQIASLPYTISTPGSYRIADTLACASATAITINCNDVDLDFCGHYINGSYSSTTQYYGISAFNRERIHISGNHGGIRGFFYGVYLSDLADSVRPNGTFDGGGHVIENLNLIGQKFRGVRVEGNGNVVRGNIIRDIGGSTVYANAYAIGVESIGPGALIEDNFIYEIRGYGEADIGEGVGISCSDYSSGSIIRKNKIIQSSLNLSPYYNDWAAQSRSCYGIWVGGDIEGKGNVAVLGNTITNYLYGLTYKRSAGGCFADNRVFGSKVPYYLPNHLGTKAGALAIDCGGNISDIAPDELLSGRNTAGQIEYVEASYLDLCLPPRS